jgi:hypothetical protein
MRHQYPYRKRERQRRRGEEERRRGRLRGDRGARLPRRYSANTSEKRQRIHLAYTTQHTPQIQLIAATLPRAAALTRADRIQAQIATFSQEKTNQKFFGHDVDVVTLRVVLHPVLYTESERASERERGERPVARPADADSCRL